MEITFGMGRTHVAVEVSPETWNDMVANLNEGLTVTLAMAPGVYWEGVLTPVPDEERDV